MFHGELLQGHFGTIPLWFILEGHYENSSVVCYIWGGCSIAVIQLIITLAGIDITGWGTVLGYVFKSSINSGVIAMVGGLIIVPIISLFTKKQSDKGELDEIFECYNEKQKQQLKSI